MQRCKYTDAKTHDLDRHSCTDTHTHKYTQSTDEDIQTQKAQIQKHTEKIQIHKCRKAQAESTDTEKNTCTWLQKYSYKYLNR